EMVHRELGNVDAHFTGDRRNEPVHFAVELQRLHHFGAKDFQRTAVVVQVHAGGRRNQLVRELGRQTARQPRIFPILAPPAHDVVALVHSTDQVRQIPWVVLKVAVGGGDQPPSRFFEAGGKRGRLAEVPAKP